MKRSRINIFFSFFVLFLCSACIKNNIPYPRIQANITYIAAKGQSKAALIDSTQRIATIYLPEEANIYQVVIDSVVLSPSSEIIDGSLSKPLDLSSSYFVTLRMYQDYVWTIKASQDIERYLTVEGQIGTSVIDVPARRVLVNVSDRMNVAKLRVESMKLGPKGSITTPDLEGKIVDFSKPVVVNVEAHEHLEQWTIYVQVSKSTIATLSADAWTCVGWVYGETLADRKGRVQYRIKGDTEWLEVPSSWITQEEGNFYARITGLTPLTTYECRAVSDEEYGETLEMTTGQIVQMPNSNFEDWWLNGKVWNPWPEDGESFWDTGNKGATTLGPSNTTPTDDTVTGTGRAAKLETKFVGIGSIGKLAAGNIFVGQFLRTEGTNGVLNLGRPFTERPTRLRAYVKYQTAPISSTTTGFGDWKGRPDTCIVWCALIDSNDPFEVRTNPSNRQLFDPNGPEVIAYGKFQSGDDIPAYTPVIVDFEYYATNRVPKYILVCCSASKYGDYFTGGNGAVMYVDDIELFYDYDN